jgi:hypothetical protein
MCIRRHQAFVLPPMASPKCVPSAHLYAAATMHVHYFQYTIMSMQSGFECWALGDGDRSPTPASARSRHLPHNLPRPRSALVPGCAPHLDRLLGRTWQIMPATSSTHIFLNYMANHEL